MSEVPLYQTSMTTYQHPLQVVLGRWDLELSHRDMAAWKREFKLPWRKAGPLKSADDQVGSDQ